MKTFKLLSAVIIISLFITWNAMAYQPSEIWQKTWIPYDFQFKAQDFYWAWDLTKWKAEKQVKIMVLDAFWKTTPAEQNQTSVERHGRFVSDLFWAKHDDWWTVWYVPDAYIEEIDVCTVWSCSEQRIIKWIRKAIDEKFDVVNVSALQYLYQEKIRVEYMALLKEAKEAWIFIAFAWKNWRYWNNPSLCKSEYTECIWIWYKWKDDWENRNMYVWKNIEFLWQWYAVTSNDIRKNLPTRHIWTSFATPQFLSIVALMKSVNPNLTVEETKTIIRKNSEIYNTGRYLPNAYNCVKRAKELFTPKESNETIEEPVDEKPIAETWTIIKQPKEETVKSKPIIEKPKQETSEPIKCEQKIEYVNRKVKCEPVIEYKTKIEYVNRIQEIEVIKRKTKTIVEYKTEVRLKDTKKTLDRLAELEKENAKLKKQVVWFAEFIKNYFR